MRRIGSRAAPLAEDWRILCARVTHDVMHGEKIGRVVHLLNEVEFISERMFYFLGNSAFVFITLCSAGISESFERLLRRRIAGAQFLRILVLEIGEREGETFEKAQALVDSLRRFGEEPGHFGAAFQMPLGIGLQLPADRIERGAMADGRSAHPAKAVAPHRASAHHWSRAAAGRGGATARRVRPRARRICGP